MAEYLTAEELGIDADDLNTLLIVKDLLERKAVAFNMETFVQHLDPDKGEYRVCDTAGCIAGWMALSMAGVLGLADDEPYDYDQVDRYVDILADKRALKALFFPQAWGSGNWGLITHEQAVQAIENFLTTGDPKWAEVK